MVVTAIPKEAKTLLMADWEFFTQAQRLARIFSSFKLLHYAANLPIFSFA
jgi:hypothetical protein